MATRKTLAQEVLHVRSLKRKKKLAKAAADAAAEAHDSAERALMQRMEGEGIESIKADGTLFSPTRTIMGQVNDRAAFVKWATENDVDLLETKEKKGLVNELVRERLDNNEPPPPGVTFYINEYISQRAA